MPSILGSVRKGISYVFWWKFIPQPVRHLVPLATQIFLLVTVYTRPAPPRYPGQEEQDSCLLSEQRQDAEDE